MTFSDEDKFFQIGAKKEKTLEAVPTKVPTKVPKKGDIWFHPGFHGLPRVPNHKPEVAELIDWTPLRPLSSGKENLYDAAKGRVLENKKAEVRHARIVDENGQPSIQVMGWEQTTGLNVGQRVMKRGRRTRLTRGFIYAVGEIKVEYYANRNVSCRFRDQVLIMGDNDLPFSMGGDSGSLVVTEATDPDMKSHKAKLLLFAGTAINAGTKQLWASVASPLEPIIRELDYSFV